MSGRLTLPPSSAVFLLGQPGVGKSFLANMLLGKNAFESKFSDTGKPVTKQIQVEIATINGKTTKIIDGPGLYESNPIESKKNATVVKNALIECEGMPVQFIYVMALKGGRLGIEDIMNFESIMSAYPCTAKNVVFVVNQCPEAKMSPAALKNIFERFDSACPNLGLKTASYTSLQLFREITAPEKIAIKNILEECLKNVLSVTIDSRLVRDIHLVAIDKAYRLFSDKMRNVKEERPVETTIKIAEESTNSCTLL